MAPRPEQQQQVLAFSFQSHGRRNVRYLKQCNFGQRGPTSHMIDVPFLSLTSTEQSSPRHSSELKRRRVILESSSFAAAPAGHDIIRGEMWEIANSVTRGRMAVSKSNIAAGSVVHIEMPTAYVPYADSAHSKCSSYSYSNIETNMLSAASRSTGGKFRGYAIILAARVITSSRANTATDESVKALCRNPSLCSENIHSPHIASAQIVQRLLSSSPLTCNVELKDCLAVVEKLESNAFTVSDYDLSSISGIGLYALAAAINHSCNPNCCQTFDLSTSAALSIRALRNIEKGEEITIAYIDVGKPTWWRRKELQKAYGFLCSCNRCHSSSSDGYNCLTTSCKGIARIDECNLFHWWKSFYGQQDLSNSITKAKIDTREHSKMELSFPYGDFLEGRNDFNSFLGDTSQKFNVKKRKIKFKCDSCSSSVCSSLIEKRINCLDSRLVDVTREREHKVNLSHRKQILETLVQLVRPNDSSVIDFYRNYLLDDLLLENNFEVYLQVVRESQYLKHLNNRYPWGHPFPAIQQAVYAKCLLHTCQSVIDFDKAVGMLNKSISTLIISHGHNATIVLELLNISRRAVKCN
jgi:SET domain